MATETTKEEVIIEFKIDQGAALADLKKVEKAILDNKDAQKELNDQYKKNAVTQEEYIEESIKLQKNLKTEQENRRTLGKLIDTESNSRNALKARVSQLTKEYDNLNVKTKEGAKRQQELEQELSTLNNQISKTSKSAGLFKDQIGNYPQQLGEAAKSINLAGVSVGDLEGKLTSFINPATATVGVIGLLGAAYSHSAVGAEDFRKAQAGVSSAIDEFSNRVGNASGGGFLDNASKRFSQFLVGITSNTKAEKEERNLNLAIAKIELETLQELEVEKIKAAANAKQREKEAEDARRLRDAQETSYNDKLKYAEIVEKKLTGYQNEQVRVLNDQVRALINYGQLTGSIKDGTLDIYDTTGKIEEKNITSLETKKVLFEITQEIKDKEEEVNGKLTENVMFVNNLVAAEEKRLKALREEKKLLEDIDRRSSGGNAKLSGEGKDLQTESDIKKSFAVDESKFLIDRNQYTQESITKFNSAEEKKRFEEHQKYIEARKYADEEELAYTADLIGSLSQLFKKGGDEYKAVASLQTVISTYSAAQKAFESQASIYAVGPELGAIAAAAAIADGLARLAVINGIQFAEGGYTGSGGKYEPAGIVHKGEVVWSQHDVALAGGPTVANMMRPTFKGYADGGIVTSSLTMDTNQSLMQANAIKNMPTPIVSVKEITLTQQRIKVKESISSL